MNKLKISILLMLYDAGEKGLTDKQIADRLDINKKGFKKLETAAFRNETAQRHCLQEMGMCWIKHPEQFFKAEVTRVTPKSGFIRQLGDMPVEYFVRGRDLMGSIPGDIVLAKQTRRS